MGRGRVSIMAVVIMVVLGVSSCAEPEDERAPGEEPGQERETREQVEQRGLPETTQGDPEERTEGGKGVG